MKDSHTYRTVFGREVSTGDELRQALELAAGSIIVTSQYRADVGRQCEVLSLKWPLWFKGRMTHGKITVGDATYEGESILHVPSIQQFVILEPITFEGDLRIEWRE